jgi:hypothetical protein
MTTTDLEFYRTTADLLRKSEEQLATARRRLEAMIDRHDGPCSPKDDEPTDAELAKIVEEGRARLAKQAPPCPDCKGRSGVAVADVVSGLCRSCQAERLRIEFGRVNPTLSAPRRANVDRVHGWAEQARRDADRAASSPLHDWPTEAEIEDYHRAESRDVLDRLHDDLVMMIDPAIFDTEVA